MVRESLGPLFFGTDQIGVGEASAKFCRSLTVPFYHLCRDPAQADRMRRGSRTQSQESTSGPIQATGSCNDDVNAAVAAWIDALF